MNHELSQENFGFLRIFLHKRLYSTHDHWNPKKTLTLDKGCCDFFANQLWSFAWMLVCSRHDPVLLLNIFFFYQVPWQADDGLHAPVPWFSECDCHQLRSRAFFVEDHLQLINDHFLIRWTTRNTAYNLEHHLRKLVSKVETFLAPQCLLQWPKQIIVSSGL